MLKATVKWAALIIACAAILAATWLIAPPAKSQECLSSDSFIMIVEARIPGVIIELIDDPAPLLLALKGEGYDLAADVLVVLTRPLSGSTFVRAFSAGCATWAADIPNDTYQQLQALVAGQGA